MPSFTRRTMLAGAAAATALSAMAADMPIGGKVEMADPALAGLIDADARVEIVAEGYTWTEGPCWVGGRDGYLLFSDVPENKMHRWSPKDGASVFLERSGYAGPPSVMFREPGSNGIINGRKGIVIADSGNRCIAAVDLKTKTKRVLAAGFEGKRFNSCNDLVLAPDGAIYFTDPPYGLKGVDKSPWKEFGFWGLWRLDRSGRIDLIDQTLRVNGVGLSPDGRTLYTTDPKGWFAYDLGANGLPTGRRMLIDTATTGGRGGDGMEIDEHGNLWLSCDKSCLIYSPDGKRLGAITSDDTISNPAFGADGYVYMSNNHRILRAKVKVRGANAVLPKSAFA